MKYKLLQKLIDLFKKKTEKPDTNNEEFDPVLIKERIKTLKDEIKSENKSITFRKQWIKQAELDIKTAEQQIKWLEKMLEDKQK